MMLAVALALGQIDPDAGIVINWRELDKIVNNFTTAPRGAWLPPPLNNCSLPEMQGRPTLNLDGLRNEKYRPLFCPWLLKPFRDPFDMAVTEAGKWPVYRKLLGAANVSTGLPVAAFFGACVCRVCTTSRRCSPRKASSFSTA